MASNVDFLEFVCSQLEGIGTIRHRKMFGEYMIYINEKPVVLICDNIAYIKKHPAIAEMMQEAETGFPYDGAKEHYILDVEHKHPLIEAISALEKLLPYPKMKGKKSNSRNNIHPFRELPNVGTQTEKEFIMAKEIINDKTNPSKRLTPQYKIHPLKEKDIPEMQNLFRTTVLNINIQHYTKEEVEDWASCGDDPARWKELLSHNQYIGAFDENDCLVGFSSMNKEGYLHSMFVHKDWQGKGVATQLLFEIETLARQFNVTDITSQVSLTARLFFEKKEYKVIKSQKAKANKLKLTNFVMHKSLRKE